MEWLYIFVEVSASSLLAYWYWRHKWQEAIDMRHVTYALTFPRELTDAQASGVFSALSGLYPPIKKYGGVQASGRKTIVFEILGTPTGVHHLISIPHEYEDTVMKSLASAVPGIGIEQVTHQKRVWHEAMQLHARDIMFKSSWIGEGDNRHESPPDIDPKAVPTLIANLLSRFSTLEEDEAVLAQFVITPVGNLINPNQAGQFWALGRLAIAASPDRRRLLMPGIISAYRSFQVFVARKIYPISLHRVNDRAAPVERWPCLLDGKTLALVCGFPVGTPSIPGLTLSKGRKYVAEVALPTTGIRLGLATTGRPIAVPAYDLRRHTQFIGNTGMGKSELMAGILLQHAATHTPEEPAGFTYIDTNMDTVSDILNRIPRGRERDVIVLDMRKADNPVGINLLEGDPYTAAERVMGAFDRLYGIYKLSTTPDILRNATMMATFNGLTLIDIPALLAPTDNGKALRAKLLKNIKEDAVRDFFINEYEPMKASEKASSIAPVLRRLRPFETYPALRGSLGQVKSSFSFDDVLRDGKIIVVSLRAGDESNKLWGSLFIAMFYDAVMRRADLPKDMRHTHLLGVDEFQDHVNMPFDFMSVLDQARKYGLGFLLAHHGMSQLPPDLREAVNRNAMNKIIFKVSAMDSQMLAREIPGLGPNDAQEQDAFEAIARMMVNADPISPATIRTVPLGPSLNSEHAVRTHSQVQFGRPLEDVDRDRKERQQATPQRRRKADEAPIVGWESVDA